LWRVPAPSKTTRAVVVLYLILMALFFLDAMEEISWGQRIFGWTSPELFADNVQDETNLHNFYNPYFPYVYRALAVFPIVVILPIWNELRRRWLTVSRLVLPHPSMIGLGLLIGFVAFVWYHEQELLEEMIAVFALFYSYRLFYCLRVKTLCIQT
jgi:hypothetical protein